MRAAMIAATLAGISSVVRPPGQAVGAARAGQHARVHQNAHALLQEQRIARARLEQPLPELAQIRRIAEQDREELFGAGRLERVDAQLRIMRPAAPAVPVVGSVVHEQQHATGGQAFDQAVEQRLGLAVEPVQIFEHHGKRLALALAHEQRLDAVERAPAPLGRVERLPRRVLDRQIEQREQCRQDRLQRLVQHQHLAEHLLGAAPSIVGGRQGEIALEQIDDRRPGARPARRHRGALQHQPGAHPTGARELVEQPRLADARIADEGDDLAVAGSGQLTRPIERRQFARPADERRQATDGGGLEPGARCPDPLQIEGLDGLRQALDRHPPQAPQFDEALGEAGGGRGQPDGAGTGELLHPAREMHRRTDRVVVHAEVVADRAHQDLARMQADPDADLDAVGAALRRGLGLHGALDRERRVAGAHGMVLVRDRRAEQRHDAVAQDPVDRAFVAMHGVHHDAERRIQDAPRVLRIDVLDQRERAFDVGEQHRDLLALAFQGRARAQDALGQMPGRAGPAIDGPGAASPAHPDRRSRRAASCGGRAMRPRAPSGRPP